MKKNNLIIIFSILILCVSGCSKKIKPCEENYELVDGQCRMLLDTKNSLYTDYCENGYEIMDGQCRLMIDTKDTLYTNYCDAGYELINGKCIRKIATNKIDIKKCENGYKLNNDICSTVVTIDAQVTYSCSKGTLINDKCKIEDVPDPKSVICEKYCAIGQYDNSIDKCVSISPITGRANYYNTVCKYSCAKGELRGGMCYVDFYGSADKKYGCDSGYTLNGTKCNKTVTKQPFVVKGCPTGYLLIDGGCFKEETSELKKKYYCEDNYKLENDKCIKYDYKVPTRKYYCEDNYKLENNKCIKYDYKIPKTK